MVQGASGQSAAAVQIAVMVMNSGSAPLLCPFFDKCDGVLLINSADGSTEFHPRDRSGRKLLCELILQLKPPKLICGFIGEPQRTKLRAAGIDVRVGSCSCPVDELVNSFASLPEA